MSTREIAAKIGIREGTVSALEHGGGRARRMPRASERLGRTVIVPVDVLDALGPHAAKRSISVNHLVRLIVITVVDEGMVDAVMDDAEALDWGK